MSGGGQLIDFPIPDVLHFERRCRSCGNPWVVDCVCGATPPARDPYYVCPECRAPMPVASDARVAELDSRERQLALVPDLQEES